MSQRSETISQRLGHGFPIPGKRFPNTWETISQYLGNDCPKLGQRLPNAWERRCPVRGQRVPSVWANSARYFNNGCPMIGQRLPSAWTKFSQYVRNRCASVGQPLPRLPLSKPWARAAVASVLGNGCAWLGNRCPYWKRCPSIEQPLPNYWATCCPSIGQILFYSLQSRVIAGLCRRLLRPPRSRTQRRECHIVTHP